MIPDSAFYRPSCSMSLMGTSWIIFKFVWDAALVLIDSAALICLFFFNKLNYTCAVSLICLALPASCFSAVRHNLKYLISAFLLKTSDAVRCKSIQNQNVTHDGARASTTS